MFSAWRFQRELNSLERKHNWQVRRLSDPGGPVPSTRRLRFDPARPENALPSEVLHVFGRIDWLFLLTAVNRQEWEHRTGNPADGGGSGWVPADRHRCVLTIRRGATRVEVERGKTVDPRDTAQAARYAEWNQLFLSEDYRRFELSPGLFGNDEFLSIRWKGRPERGDLRQNLGKLAAYDGRH
ncbi:hypothetical protein GCM10027199_37710 [Amycolatopsis magusensis]